MNVPSGKPYKVRHCECACDTCLNEKTSKHCKVCIEELLKELVDMPDPDSN